MDRLRQLQVMLAVLAAAVLLSGCGVTITHPLPPSELEPEERALFEGTWVRYGQNYEPYTIRFVCNGRAEVTALSFGQKGQVELEQWQMNVTKGKKDTLGRGYLTLYVSEPVEGAKGTEELSGHPFYRYELGPDLLLLWFPQRAPFEEAIKLRRLSGEISTELTIVTSDPQVLLDFMGDPDDLGNPELFDRTAVLLRKVDSAHNTEPLKPCGRTLSGGAK